jgi:hypothetical protein
VIGRQAYEELLDKFSGSSSLLSEYAHFCDVVLNDEGKAETFRERAALLETASGDRCSVACCPRVTTSSALSNHFLVMHCCQTSFWIAFRGYYDFYDWDNIDFDFL